MGVSSNFFFLLFDVHGLGLGSLSDMDDSTATFAEVDSLDLWVCLRHWCLFYNGYALHLIMLEIVQNANKTFHCWSGDDQIAYPL